MKTRLVIIFFALSAIASHAQKFAVEKSFVRFYSHATLEDITAENKKSAGLFDASSKSLVFAIPIADFEFAKSLMQEHFNEKYMESDKYPKATFQGKVDGYDPASASVQQAKAKGQLTIHGVTRTVVIPGAIEKKEDRLQFKSTFIIRLADYQVEIPKLVWQKIAEQVEVTVDFTFKPQAK